MPAGVADTEADQGALAMGDLMSMAAAHPAPQDRQEDGEKKYTAGEEAAGLGFMIGGHETDSKASNGAQCRNDNDEHAPGSFLACLQNRFRRCFSGQQSLGRDFCQGPRGPKNGQQAGGQCGGVADQETPGPGVEVQKGKRFFTGPVCAEVIEQPASIDRGRDGADQAADQSQDETLPKK